MTNSPDVDVAIVGAGAAGLGAARTLAAQGKTFVLLEASHRIGGRGYTEEIMPGVPFDLGCHWMHSASLNPFVEIADEFGMAYTKDGFERGIHSNGAWGSDEELAELDEFYERQQVKMRKSAEEGDDCSFYEATEREHRWTPFFDYFCSLDASADVDQISVVDFAAYNDTDENWPLKDGYGTLLSQVGAEIPVSLNSAVRSIDWSGGCVVLETAKGTVTAGRVVLTVSNGILAAGDIRFTPDLPDWKHQAVAGLPIGNYNRIGIAFDRDVFGPGASSGFTTDAVDGVPMAMSIRPFGYNYVVGITSGRFADWLERAGQQASIDYVEKKLQAVFGTDITKHVSATIVTAWGGDPWVRGAYSAALPGQSHQRSRLAEPLEDRIYFAGEATSTDAYATAHGAYLSGISAAETIAGNGK